MDKEEIKNRINLDNIQEKRIEIIKDIEIKRDYLVDFEGNFILPISPIEFKLIEEIKLLKERILKLEETEVSTK